MVEVDAIEHDGAGRLAADAAAAPGDREARDPTSAAIDEGQDRAVGGGAAELGAVAAGQVNLLAADDERFQVGARRELDGAAVGDQVEGLLDGGDVTGDHDLGWRRVVRAGWALEIGVRHAYEFQRARGRVEGIGVAGGDQEEQGEREAHRQ